MNEIGSGICQDSVLENKKNPVKNKSKLTAAKELLKNGILVETNKGLVCMSLADALNNGVGGHSLSVEDLQTVATELLFQDEPKDGGGGGGGPKRKETLIWDMSTDLPKTILKQVKSRNLRKEDLDKISNARESVDEIKSIQKSLLGYSSLDNCLTDTEVDNEPELCHKGKLLIELDLGSPRLESVKGQIKKPFETERGLLLAKNAKPVNVSIQKLVAPLSGTSTECILSQNTCGLDSVLVSSSGGVKDGCSLLFNENYTSCGETSDNSEVTAAVVGSGESKPAKKRGGWPKGRKRKPEVKHEHRPPKAPATGYVLFLNERRKEYRDMPFTEVTKLLGNEWSRLSLQEKKVYLDQAEIEKKRYREELRHYRQSDAYQNYLHNKRLRRLQGHGTEESDMDATDEIDEEDNEELYCRSCDQWFHSLHNKKEHLYGRQHLQSIAGRYTKSSDPDWCNANMSSTSLDDSSLDGSSYLKTTNKDHCCGGKDRDSLNMDDAIVRFMIVNKEREQERRILRKKLDESKARKRALSSDLQRLNETVGSLTCLMESERSAQVSLEQCLFNLLNVPTLFYLLDPLSEENN